MLQAQLSVTVYLQNYIPILTVLNLLLIAVLKRFISVLLLSSPSDFSCASDSISTMCALQIDWLIDYQVNDDEYSKWETAYD